MKALFTIMVTVFLSSVVFGTEQIPDKLIYKGKEYELQTNPMESYFKKYPDKRPKGAISSACWRGYVATFEIKNNQLYLKDIEVEFWNKGKINSKSVLNKLFPKQEMIKIDWFTGLLIIPYGEIVDQAYLSLDYGSLYEHYILLEIENGNLNREKQFEHQEYEEFKDKKFQAYKETEEYKKTKEELKEAVQWDDDLIDYVLRSYTSTYIKSID